jgi:hypothetical protein
MAEETLATAINAIRTLNYDNDPVTKKGAEVLMLVLSLLELVSP